MVGFPPTSFFHSFVVLGEKKKGEKKKPRLAPKRFAFRRILEKYSSFKGVPEGGRGKRRGRKGERGPEFRSGRPGLAKK